jgi:type I restriction enzyme S subunit
MKLWPKVRIGEILKQIERPEAVDASSEYRLLGVRWYGQGLFVKDVKNGQQIIASRLYRIQDGDFVYNRLFAWKGSFAVADSEFDGCYVSNEFPCFQPDRSRLETNFLLWFSRREGMWEEALGLSTGATPTSRNRLKEAHFLNLEIPLPPLQEQQRIVARIEELSSLINEARTLRRQAVKEAEALISSTRRKEIGNQSLSDWIPLSRIVSEIENGKSPQCESRAALENEWGVLKVGAVSFGNFNPHENKAWPSAQPYSAHYEVHPGDFLMSRANTTELVGACAIVGQTRPKLLLSDKIFRFHFHDQSAVILQWLDHVMKSPALRDQIERAASGTSPTMKNISKEKTLNLLIPPHSISKQRQIISHLNRLQAEMNSMKHLQSDTAEEIDAMLPAILDRAFKGELI